MAGVAPLIVIVGQTASGKSALALEIAKQINGEIVCADSRTVYKGMDIGTAKPNHAEQAEVPHHLLDVVTPSQPFTVVDFTFLAQKAINTIWSKGRWPILVGGSGLFIDAIIFNYSFGTKASVHERTLLTKLSIEELQAKLREQGIPIPENSKNKRFLIRALQMKGLLQQKRVLRKNTIVVGLSISKDTLEDKIASRVNDMVRMGVLDEVRRLSKKYGWDYEPMKSNIYKVLKPVVYQGGTITEEILEQAKKADRHLAKKQLTWFKRNEYVHWGTSQALKKQIASFIKKHSR
ncbi:MAG TPA: tRNA (adenosine(37)-N6)-dimethylallyltransferase MiaA [Candidatus Saccharimonadales bacterium]|nr:tRNA (adenosine(37)-N6)-dimethylallyltransferase MiaA [Candidatus Saccharimonadales bacterium]